MFGVAVVEKDDERSLLTVTESGYGKNELTSHRLKRKIAVAWGVFATA